MSIEIVHFNANQTLDETLTMILSGQLLRFSVTTMLLVNSAWGGYLTNYATVQATKSLDNVFNSFHTHIDGYVSFLDIQFGVEEDGGNNYEFFNQLMLDERLLIPAMTEEQLVLCSKYGIPQTVVYPKEKYNRHMIIFQNPSFTFGLLDMAFANQAKLVWNPYTFGNYEHLLAPFEVYGYSGSIGGIPMEGVTVREISKQGGVLFPSDGHGNLAVHKKFDSIVGNLSPKPIKYVTTNPTDHLIAFINSDGDNLNIMSYLASRRISVEKDFPVTWTVGPTAPRIYMKSNYDEASEMDGFIVGPSGFGYCYPNMMNTAIQTDYQQKTLKTAQEIGLDIVNQINISVVGLFSFIQEIMLYFSYWSPYPEMVEVPGVKAVLGYDYFTYDLGKGKYIVKDGTAYLSSTQKLYFDYDENILLTSKFEDGGFTIVPVNHWLFQTPKLQRIVNQLRNDSSNVKFVTLSQLVDERLLNKS